MQVLQKGVIEMIDIFRGYVRTKDKKPIQKFKGIENLPTIDEVSKYSEYAGILNNDYTVMDVDDGIEAEKTYKLVCDENINCRVIKTTRGMHFVFKKNKYATKGNTHQINALGFTFDIRTGENQYIVVKKDGKTREILRDFDESRKIDEYPKIFKPIISDATFTGMKDGSGRNGKLFNHLITLTKNGFTKEECKDIIKLINVYSFDEPLSDYEINQIVRDEAFAGIELTGADKDFEMSKYKPTTFSDVAMAELFSKHYKDEMRYNPGTDWLVWNGCVWEMSEFKAQLKYIDFIKKVMECAKEEVKEAYNGEKGSEEKVKAANKFYNYVIKMSDAGKINAVLKLARSYLLIEIDELDKNPFDLNTPDGIIDLRTGMIKDHSKEALCTKITKYSPSNKGEDIWHEFLKTITEENEELENYLQIVSGAIAIGKVYHEGLVIAHGEGANGKSTLFNTMFEVLGDYSGKIPAESLTTKVKNAKVDLAELLGKRFILASETEEGHRLSIAMLKQIASIDKITAEKKYHDLFVFEPTHTTVLYTNHLPKVGSNDKGTWRRIIVAPFNAVIKKPKKDYQEYLLKESAEAILKWIIDGAMKFINNKYELPKCKVVEEAITEYKEENDWLNAFILDSCITGELEKTAGGILYTAYKKWCEKTGEYAKRNRDFAEALKMAGYKSKRKMNGTEWQGLSVSSSMLEEDFL